MNILWDITVGNIVTILGGIVATALVWQKLNDRVDVNEKQTTKNTAELDEITRMAIQTTLAQHERRIAELEQMAKAMLAATAALQQDVRWIRDNLEHRSGER